jgi:hypothetical protein
MEKTVRIVSFQEAEELDIQYWKKATPEEKLDTLQALRDIYYTLQDGHGQEAGLERRGKAAKDLVEIREKEGE